MCGGGGGYVLKGNTPVQVVWLGGGNQTTPGDQDSGKWGDQTPISLFSLNTNFTEEVCKDGFFNQEGHGVCTPCPEGFFMNESACEYSSKDRFPWPFHSLFNTFFTRSLAFYAFFYAFYARFLCLLPFTLAFYAFCTRVLCLTLALSCPNPLAHLSFKRAFIHEHLCMKI